MKYTDEISYDKIFNCLSENLKFNPQIIHTDFEKSLLTSIKKYSLCIVYIQLAYSSDIDSAAEYIQFAYSDSRESMGYNVHAGR